MGIQMARKILLVSDYVMKKQEMLDGFKFLEDYGAEFLTVDDAVGESPEEFQARMLYLEQNGPESITPSDHLLEQVKEAEILVVHLTAVSSRLLQVADKLKLIAVLRGGVENVNLEAAGKKGLLVVNSPGRSADAVSDFAIGLMISVAKNIVRGSLLMRKGQWVKEFENISYTYNLRGKTIGLVGFGEVGRRLVKKLSGFDVKILVYDPYVPKDVIEIAGCKSVTLSSLLKESDFISLHARLTQETEQMIGTPQFKIMKSTAYLINTARAGLVDEKALVQALKNGALGGAAIDVFSQEPVPPESPLFSFDNVVLTPHLAGVSCDTKANSIEILGKEIERFLKKEVLQYLVK